MEIQKSIDLLNQHLCTWRGKFPPSHIGAIKVAIVALKKQSAQKPSENYNWADFSEEEKLENTRWFCRSCGWEIKDNQSYCSECGQKIDCV